MNFFVRTMFFVVCMTVCYGVQARTVTIQNRVVYPIAVRQVNIENGVDLYGNALVVGVETVDKAKTLAIVSGNGQSVLSGVANKNVTLEFVYLPDDPEPSRARVEVPAGSEDVCILLTWPGDLRAQRVKCR